MQKTYPMWVSHSSIGDFLSCPRAYYLRQVYDYTPWCVLSRNLGIFSTSDLQSFFLFILIFSRIQECLL